MLDEVPPGHTAQIVTHGCFEPHLKEGEFAVIDLADKEPAAGEIFVIGYNSATAPGGVRRTLCVPRRDTGGVHFVDKLGRRRPGELWWVDHDMMPRQAGGKPLTMDEVIAALSSGRKRLSEGPFDVKHLRSKLVGRVVGVLASTGGLF